MSSETGHKAGALTRLRNYFLTGLVITAPLVITLYLTWTLVKWVDSWIIPYIPAVYNPSTYLPFYLPGAGLLIAAFVITTIGFLTANIIGRSIVSWGENMVDRMPLVRNIYNGLKQIFQTVLSNESASFQKVGLMEYPRKGVWALVFIATDTRGEVAIKLNEKGEDTLSVFLPTTPNPTSGFLLFVRRDEVTILEMGVEDGAKMVISAGLVAPKKNGRKEEGGQKPAAAPVAALVAPASETAGQAARAQTEAPSRKRSRKPAPAQE
jgi:uncharacterized membrane protein